MPIITWNLLFLRHPDIALNVSNVKSCRASVLLVV
jgi:hypothetical protein